MTTKIDVTVGKFKVIDSGVIHTTESEFEVKVFHKLSDEVTDTAKFIVRFKSDTGDRRFETIPDERNGCAYIDLINYKGLGGGLFHPILLATMDDGTDILFTYTISTYGIDNEAKNLSYAFYAYKHN